jgi:hypothetical protein
MPTIQSLVGVPRVYLFERRGPRGRRQLVALDVANPDPCHALPLFTSREKAEGFRGAEGAGWRLREIGDPGELLGLLRTLPGRGVPLLILDPVPDAAAPDRMTGQSCTIFSFLVEAEAQGGP